jgi:hypothetical protein
MAGPFKMKGSPMARNFGVGSPLHQDFKKEGKQLKKTEIGPKAPPMVDENKNEIPDFVESNESKDGNFNKKPEVNKAKPKANKNQPGKPVSPTMPKSHPVTPPTNNKKKKKAGWFGFKDQGITEALDAFTKKRNE